MKSRTYDALKYIAIIALPAVAVFWGVVGPAWEVPNTDKIIISINAVDGLLGALLVISKKAYDRSGAKYAGEVYLGETEDGTMGVITDLQVHPQDVPVGKDIVLKNSLPDLTEH